MSIIKTHRTHYRPGYAVVPEKKETVFDTHFHAYPEFELVYIRESCGKWLIGNHIVPFRRGDMVLIGSNLPQRWFKDDLLYQERPAGGSKAIVACFNCEILGPAFYQLAESAALLNMFARAAGGIRIKGTTRNMVAEKLEKLAAKKGLEKIIGLLEIFHLISVSADTECLASENFTGHAGGLRLDRFRGLFTYIKENHKNDVSLAHVAGLVNLTPQSFCRLFKKRTGKPFIRYLNETRVATACRHLMNTDWDICEIAYACGYKTISNFNKIFKAITGLNPRAYREKIQ